jgi:hypothetical protein
MINLCTDYVNPKIKSIYFAIQNQLKVGNYHYIAERDDIDINNYPPISDENKLLKKSVETLIVLWHLAHENDRYKSYYNTIMLPNYFIFPNDYKSILDILKSIDFHELLVLIAPVTVRSGLSEEEQKKLDQLESRGTNSLNKDRVN